MVTSYLMGGLGNYLFQISTAYSLAEDNNSECFFDLNNYQQIHEPIPKYLDNILRNINFPSNPPKSHYSYVEPFFHFSQLPYVDHMTLNGYFQSEKYFTKNRFKILELYSIDSKSQDLIFSKYDKVLSGSKTCSIHVRRGNYLSLSNAHPSCTLDYYTNAIKKFSMDYNFLVFSDDIEWCKKVFTEGRFTFIEGNQDYIDMWLMSLCSNNIIANSSFSWWGAWLNKNPKKKVIAPSNWFGSSLGHSTIDLIPSEWLTI